MVGESGIFGPEDVQYMHEVISWACLRSLQDIYVWVDHCEFRAFA